MRGAEISKTPWFPHFWCAAHVLPFVLLCVESIVILEACWNRILTIFDLYTFSHSQGQQLACRTHRPHGRRPSESRPNRCSAANGESVPCSESSCHSCG